MNLIGDKWLPVVFADGRQELVSLKELYEKSSDIRDLVLNPPQRISVMRFLICITQAALDGPKDEEDWLNCESRIIPESLKYLNERKDKFDLYGDKPFLQVKNLKANEKASIDKLNLCLSSGNNSVLFDHSAVPEGRHQNSPEKVLNILTALNFSNGGKVGQGICGAETLNFSTYAAPCVKSAHTFIRSENMLRTLHFNIIPKSILTSSLPNYSFGSPVWDNFPVKSNSASEFENASRTYLGRLAPLSRFILLDDKPLSNECIFSPTPKNFKFEGIPAFREHSTTIIRTKKDELISLIINSSKHVWRELGSVLVIAKASNNAGGALCLQNISTFKERFGNATVDIWVGGVESDQAKNNDLVEWNISLPVSIFGESNLSKYQKGVELSNNGSTSLSTSVSSYCKYCKSLDLEKKAINAKAQPMYWSILDSTYKTLVDTATDDTQPLDGEWRDKIKDAMNKAYSHACPRETPWQIQAYAQGRKFLNIRKTERTEDEKED
jgi:CRISPR system Cascade subunit CasA